ncbi:Ser/Thr protein kinase RdoA (MazF antagonist) [Sporosarcina luteola]|nr:Ser/Thr protein kinase RdoA (MazF antagonist) [Sporosarcina luteola]
MLNLQVTEAYPIGQVSSSRKLDRGNSAETYQIQSEKGSFILKSMATLKEAEFEYRLHEHLKKVDHLRVPKIHLTSNHHFAVLIESTYFQLQSFIPSTVDTPSIANWVDAFFRLQKGLASFEWKESDRLDRFSLEDTWKQVYQSWKAHSIKELEWLEQTVAELSVFDNLKPSWIHGDLGKWNTLYNGRDEQLAFIDFGEARRGHPYFDFAALLTSYAPNPQDTILFHPYLNEVIQEYEKHFPVNFELLNQFIRLWFVRGIVAAGIHSPYGDIFKESLQGYEEYFKRKTGANLWRC